jgi:Spy/CpxP family protein refolding chaperone
VKHLVLIALSLLTVAATSAAHSPYAGQQNRQMKTLDAATVSALRRGEGHGMALAGELNHYPGPRHVLAMSDHLQLTAAQKSKTDMIYERMHTAAVRVGLEVIEKERALDHAFQNGSVSDSSLRTMTSQIAALNGQLRYIHLSAHLAMKHILTPTQIRMYDSMRGYVDGMRGMQH